MKFTHPDGVISQCVALGQVGFALLVGQSKFLSAFLVVVSVLVASLAPPRQG